MSAKVLVVDDNDTMRDLLALHLRNAGYTVETATDGIAAGDAVLRSRPDLIICEMAMRNLGSVGFVHALRADATLRNIPVIFICSDAETLPGIRELRGATFLRKPIRVDSFLRVVASKVPDGLVPIG